MTTGSNEHLAAELTRLQMSIAKLIKAKNLKYGNAALTPINVFNKSDAKNSLLVRIDDKLSRIQNSKELSKNDVVDLYGYLSLLLINEGWTNFDELID